MKRLNRSPSELGADDNESSPYKLSLGGSKSSKSEFLKAKLGNMVMKKREEKIKAEKSEMELKIKEEEIELAIATDIYERHKAELKK